MRTLKFLPMLALLLAVVSAGAIPQEPSLSQAAPAAFLKPASPKYALPAGARRIASDSDELFGWYETEDGCRYLVYEWGKPATVYSVTVSDRQKVSPGRELLMPIRP